MSSSLFLSSLFVFSQMYFMSKQGVMGDKLLERLQKEGHPVDVEAQNARLVNYIFSKPVEEAESIFSLLLKDGVCAL